MDRRAKSSHGLPAIGVTALVVGPALLLYAYIGQSSLDTFRQKGLVQEAMVTDKRIVYTPSAEYRVKVSLFTGPILEGGELFLVTIDEFIPTKLWNLLHKGDKVNIVYLPDDPNQVILEASLDSANLAPIYRYELGAAALALGVILLIAHKVLGPSPG